MAYLDGPRPRLFAHRGSCGTHPENTLEAFAEGLAAGAERLELDVHRTRDGHIVVFHDDDLARTTDANGLLRHRTLAELKSLDAGWRFEDEAGGHPFRGRGIRIPTLSEVLEAFPGVALNIEVKHDDGTTVERFFDVLDRHGARDCVLAAAYEDPILRRIRAVAPDMLTSLSGDEVVAFFAAWMSGSLADYVPPGKAFQVPPDHEGMEIVTAEFVKAVHGLGMEVHVWTINVEAEVARLLDLGVDGVMTDFPSRARRVFEGRGLRPRLLGASA